MKKNNIFKIFTLVISFLFVCVIGFVCSSTNVSAAGESKIAYEQFETPDVVSIRDIANGQNKISLEENKRYTYPQQAAYGSLIFKFQFENNRWDNDSNFQIYLMLDEASYSGDAWWNSGNCIWFKYGDGGTCMMQDKPDGSRGWSITDSISAGNHDIELGRIAIKEQDGSFDDRYYCFVKVDGEIKDECINRYEASSLMNQFHITNSNDVNKLVDANWTGNKVVYMANGEKYDELFTKEYKLTKPTDPYVEGKVFKGWFDTLGNQWDFEKDEVLGDLTLTAAFVSSSSQEISDEEYFADDSYTPVLRFLVSSDTHVGSDGGRQDRLAKEIQVAYSYADNSLTYNNLDAALYAGDLSDDGSPSALANWKSVADNNFDYNETKLVLSMGNHEFRTYDSATREIKVFEDTLKQKCDYHTVINGYHFIALSPNLNEGYNFSSAKAAWLDEQLAIAAADTPDKPIFVIQHEGVTGTIYGSDAWGNSDLTEVLCKYPQVVDFSGHSHYPLADPRSIWQGTFTALGTGTLHYYEMGINGYKSGGVFPADKNGGWATGSSSASSTAEFQIVEIDANNAMRVIVYDLINDREITRYYMRDLMEERKLTYSHTERANNASAPYFDGVTLHATAEENTIKIEFNQATGDDAIVESYRIELYKKNKLVQTEYALSDYFFYPMPNTIKLSVPNLEENTEYKIKVYAVNVWNMQSATPIEATVTTGKLTIYEDVVDEISLNDLYGVSDKKQITTDTLNSYKPVYFVPSENNVYGSFKLTTQLLYIGENFQVCFNKEFNNDDLVWFNNDGKIWFVEGGKGPKFDPVEPGLHKMEYGRYHTVEENTSYTVFYVKIDDVLIHETKSTGIFTNDGYFSLNFGSAYGVGSRYYDISYNVPKNDTPVFEQGSNITLSTPITNWSELGGAITFDSTSKSLNMWLEDATGAVTNVKTFNGTFLLGKNGDFYHYEIKTNKFDLAPGITGEELIYKLCFEETDFEIGNVDITYYEAEQLAQYDEISMKDIQGVPENGIYTSSPQESGLPYNGTSPTYSAVLKYYLVCDDITAPDSEFRSQLGTLWSYYCTLWLQPGNSSTGFFGFQYTTRPTDKYTLNFEPQHIYLIETGTIRVEKGEYAGWNYTYFKVDNELMSSFYVHANECASTSYHVAFKIVNGYSAADISLARTIKYVVDGKEYASQLAISGANIYEPKTPTVEGKYFTGWYTQPTGGERVDFSKKFISDEKTVTYYARYSTDLLNVKFYSEGEEYQTQSIGRGGQALEPEEPKKTGAYKYSFVKWVIKGTDTEYDFTSEITDNLELEAVFEEYRYRIVYKADGVDYDTKYYLESNPSTIIGGEPTVPTYKGATGYWVYAIETRTKGDTYAIAKYDGTSLTTTNDISLAAFNGKEVDIADDLTRYYLSFANTEAQGKWLVDYPVAGGHERQDITFSWSDVSGNSFYVVYFADNIEFTNAFIVRTNKTVIDYVGIFEPGKTYYWKVVGENTNKESAVDTFKILNTPVRWFSADTVFNTRDIGGWTTIDNKQVVYGKIYRGGQLRLDQSGERSYMSDYSHKVFDYLGIKTEIELRGESTHTINQINEFERMIYVNGVGYEQIFAMSDSHKANYRTVFTALADESNYPFYFHCSWGADRTGALGFFINGLLGVPYEQLVEDYELTSLSYSGKRVRGSNGYKAMYDELLEQYHDEADPTNFQKAMENYMINYVGVKKSEIDSLKEIMLVNATTTADTHTVTFRIDGKEYNQFNVFDGNTVSAVAPLYFDRHVCSWLNNGVEYDLNTPITSDITLDAKFEETLYEDYDVVTVRDLDSFDRSQWNYDLGETWEPQEYIGKFEGYSENGSRMFEFDYEIPGGGLGDGVHIEIGSHMWLFKSHVWLADSSTIHVFTSGTQDPVATLSYQFKSGQTYHVQVGVVIPANGEDAGKKILVLLIDDEILLWIDSNADLTSGYNIGMAGLQGKLYSTENKMSFTFKDANGETIETKQIQRGQKAVAIENPEAPENQKFIGWFDELGNQWDFASQNVLKDVTLFAKYGDVTVDAIVLDDNDFEIVSNYQVKLGESIGELVPPTVKNTLEFVGWYNGETKLSANDVVTEEMNLICRFKVVKQENPDEPVNPDKPEEPEAKGCKGNVASSISFIALLSLIGIVLFKRKRSWGC